MESRGNASAPMARSPHMSQFDNAPIGMQLVRQVGESYFSPLVRFVSGRSRWEIDLLCLLITGALGIIHYLLGPTVPLSLAYAIPVVIAAWFSGAVSGAIFSVLCVAIWFLGSYPTGHVVPVTQSPFYGALIRLTEYGLYTAVFVRLSHLQRNLKDLAEQRALALTQEFGAACQSGAPDAGDQRAGAGPYRPRPA